MRSKSQPLATEAKGKGQGSAVGDCGGKPRGRNIAQPLAGKGQPLATEAKSKGKGQPLATGGASIRSSSQYDTRCRWPGTRLLTTSSNNGIGANGTILTLTISTCCTSLSQTILKVVETISTEWENGHIVVFVGDFRVAI